MIKVKNITKIFGRVRVLDDISFEVSDELVAILGPTGEGKTVLLKIIAGLIKPDSGQVIIDEPPNDSAKCLVQSALGTRHLPLLYRGRGEKETIGFVFQHSALFDSLTVEENIRLPLEECSSLKDKEIKERVKSVGEMLSLDQYMLQRSCLELSGGERKIVAVARAIINNPTYLLYDEPTTGLDPLTHDKICDIIRGLNKPGIIVSHNMDTIKKIGIKTIYSLKIGELSQIQ